MTANETPDSPDDWKLPGETQRIKVAPYAQRIEDGELFAGRYLLLIGALRGTANKRIGPHLRQLDRIVEAEEALELTYVEHLARGRLWYDAIHPGTPPDDDPELDGDCMGLAHQSLHYDIMRAIGRITRPTPIGPIGPLPVDDLNGRPPETGVPPIGASRPLQDARAPFLAIARWAMAASSSTRHVFRFEPQQGAVFGVVGTLLAHGMSLEGALETATEITGDHATRRKWRDGMRRAQELLYIVGSLGKRGALRSDDHLDAAVEQLDQEFMGAWKGDDLTLLKAISRTAQPTDSGFGHMTPKLLTRFLESTEPGLAQAQQDARRSLERLSPTDDEAVDVVHRSESLVAERSARPDPHCILHAGCEDHRSNGGEDL